MEGFRPWSLALFQFSLSAEGAMRMLGVSRRESQETPEQTLARLNAGTSSATWVDQTPTRPPQSFAERSARIPQWRWRIICVAFWPFAAFFAITVFGLVDAFWPRSTPDDAGVAMLIAFGVTVAAFWRVGVRRTEQIDPGDWTPIQRVSKNAWQHTPSG